MNDGGIWIVEVKKGRFGAWEPWDEHYREEDRARSVIDAVMETTALDITLRVRKYKRVEEESSDGK